MVLDGAVWHSSHALTIPNNLYLSPLPSYAPELNPVEHIWDELREKCFHNLAFDSLDALEDRLELTFQSNGAQSTSREINRSLALDLLVPY